MDAAVSAGRYLDGMRWYSRPEGTAEVLGVTPRLASWERADHPDQVRLRGYLDAAETLLADSRVDRPWALRLDVGLPTDRDLLDMGDLDNYALPLAARLNGPNLVSVWCTKQHSEQSLVRIEPAHETSPPSTALLIAHATSATGYKRQIHAAVADAAPLPPGPVRLELALVVGPSRNWMNLWKENIDALDPLLGRTYPDRDWHPLDGRVTELGMHVEVDPCAGYAIVVGIAASPADAVTQPDTTVLPTKQSALRRYRIHTSPGEKAMSSGLDEFFPPTPEVWTELARRLMAGDHLLGKAVGFMETEGTDAKVLAAQLGIKPDYASWLLSHARKMKQGIIRVVVSGKNEGRESASIQAHHYRYVLDDDLTAATRRYVESVISKFQTVNADIPMTAAQAQGAKDSYRVQVRPEPEVCMNPDCQWAWTRHGGECS